MNAQAPVPALCVQDLAVLHGEDVLVDATSFSIPAGGVLTLPPVSAVGR